MVLCVQAQNFPAGAESAWVGVGGTKTFQVKEKGS